MANTIEWWQCDNAVKYWRDFARGDDPDFGKNDELVPALFRALIAREPIPEIRLRYFTDPKLPVGLYGKSHKQIFEKNGTTGLAIYQHPHFLPFLWYFIHGSRLPGEIKAEVSECCNDSLANVTDVIQTCRRLLRDAVRLVSCHT